MRMKDLFDKVDTYNEIAGLLQTGYDVKICFTFTDFDSETFSNYKEFKSYLKTEVVDDLANFILTSNAFEFNAVLEYDWVTSFGDIYHYSFCPELTY